MQRRLPAEWEPQDAVLLAWPHEATDWAYMLDEARQTFVLIVETIARFQRVLLVCPDPAELRERFGQANVSLFALPTDDTWARDFGPITIMENGWPVLLDYQFNGWGNKFGAARDNGVTAGLQVRGAFGPTALRTMELVLEGGSIESDGAGTLLTTATCLLNPNRNPGLAKAEIERRLAEQLGATRFLWLEHGWLAGDDTDAHIDTLARLCPEKTIVYTACDDPADEHYDELKKMEAELQRFAGYRLLPLPWPAPRYEEDGHRLPATYANFLVINGAVLVPTYDCPADRAALEVIGRAFAGREIIGIDCRALIRQHGSLHCVTMQLPAGTLG